MFTFKTILISTALFVAHAALAATGTIGSSAASPSSLSAGTSTAVSFTSVITSTAVLPASVNLLQVNSLGQSTVIGQMYDDGTHGDAIANDGIFTLQFPILQQTPGALTFRVSAAFQGSLTRALSAPITVNVTGTGTAVTINSPAEAAYLSVSPTIVTGSVLDPAATVTVNGLPAQVSGGTYRASIPLREGSNKITAAAVNSNGVSTTATETITLDTTPPHVTISAPAINAITDNASVNVSGIVNDIVVGTVNPLQATVTVNGVAAQVANRTYIASGVPLHIGANTITATATDRAGNYTTTSITVTRVAAATQSTLRILSGDGGSGPIKTVLGSPLRVQALNAAGQPIAGLPVVFQVVKGDGSVGPSATGGLSSIAVNTDGQGTAQVNLILGSHAGAGNQQVLASATGIAVTPIFTESATTTGSALIVVDSGGNQSGVVGQLLPLPFIAVVTDAGHNRLANVPVSFTVTQGGGTIDGEAAINTTSDSDGRVQAVLTLGPQSGISNNVVNATFPGNAGLPASFTATAYQPGPAANTAVSGTVLDNSNQPIPGVTIHLYQVNNGGTGVPQEVVGAVQTDASGYFQISHAPVGVYKLMADGTTATKGGPFPTLEYDIVTVSGQNLTVGQPIYLQQLHRQNELCVSPTVGGTLTIPEAPGFALKVDANTAIFPGGSRTGCISVTPVNMDKVPMVPGFGQQPRFIVTIQPVGTIFTTPAQLTIPNVDGLAPRAVTEMYSYDHDLASFVAIGTGTVSADGSTITSDPGVGVLKAGWHCGGDPNSSGSAGTCPTCQKCQGSGCVPDDAAKPANKCQTCENGKAKDFEPKGVVQDQSLQGQVKLPDSIKDLANSMLNRIGVPVSFEEADVNFQGTAKDCCNPANGNVTPLGEKTGTVGVSLKATLKNTQLWPPPPAGVIDRTWDVQDPFGNIYELRVVFTAGVFFSSDVTLGGSGGVRKSSCDPNNSCIFGGLSSDLSNKLAAQVMAQACAETSLSTTTVCTPTLDVTPAAISFNVTGQVGYNQASCTSGLSGSLKVGAVKFSADFKVPLLPTVTYEATIFDGFCLLGC